MNLLDRPPSRCPSGVTLPGAAPDGNPFGWLEASAESLPDAVAVEDRSCRLTCRELHDASLLLAGYMQQRLGVRRGDRVLILMPPCAVMAVAWYATLRCEAVVIDIDAESSIGAISVQAWHASARVAILLQDGLARLGPLLDDGRLRGCIVATRGALPAIPGAGARLPRLHAFDEALAAGIAPAAMRAAGDTGPTSHRRRVEPSPPHDEPGYRRTSSTKRRADR